MRSPAASSRAIALLAVAIVSIWTAAGTTIALRPAAITTDDAVPEVGGRTAADGTAQRDATTPRPDASERVQKKRPGKGSIPQRRSGATDDGPALFEIDVEPSCLSPGGRGVVRLRTVRQVQFSLIVFYHDENPRHSWYAGVTESGSFDYPFVVPPDTPTTTGEVQVAGQRLDGKAADTESTRFRVVSRGTC